MMVIRIGTAGITSGREEGCRLFAMVAVRVAMVVMMAVVPMDVVIVVMTMAVMAVGVMVVIVNQGVQHRHRCATDVGN
jgi:hypothetical protein